MSASRVEVSQQRPIPLFKRLARLLCIVAFGINEIRNDQLDRALRTSVWVGWANWAVLWNRNHVGNSCRIAIYGCGGGEDDIVDIVLVHAPKEGNGSAHIDAVVFERNLARLADRLENMLAALECQDTIEDVPLVLRSG